jgi:hypothetical protein
MTEHNDLRIAQALNLITCVGDLLQRSERILRTTDVKIPRLDVVLRGLQQANQNLAIAWNAGLADIRSPQPKVTPPPPAEPSSFMREITSRGHDTPEAHAARERDAAAAARSIRVER